ncbi:MAG: ECF transporter S component [Oscillospiraceae bacterium]
MASLNKDKNDNKLLKICVTAMFAALICVATMLIQIPSPLNGYVNFGDCFILIAAWVLGPVYGFAAGGIGSALADLFSGYAHYVPGTFVIKGLIAVAAALIVRAFMKKSEKLRLPGFIVGGIAGEVIMVAGYYLYAALLLGKSFEGALASVPGNLVQGAFGVIVGTVVIQIIAKTKVLAKFDAYAV